MEKRPEKLHPDAWLKDLPALAESANFKPEDLLDCPQCARKNAPTRLKCIYCGAPLPVAETVHLKQLSRKLETWEKGFNIIYLPQNRISGDAKIIEIAGMLRLEPEDLQKILGAEKPLPAARAESEAEAKIISEKLRESGFESVVIGDEQLKIQTVTRRLRGLEFFGEKIVCVLFNRDEIVELAPQDLCLIVSGTLFERRVESLQKHERRRENKILESSEQSRDEVLIDLYSREDAIGYRISSKGFDFSCLEGEKELFAGSNLKKLTEKLRAFAPAAKFDDDYGLVRPALGGVWAVEQRTDAKKMRRKNFGQYQLESVEITSNLSQFTRYSRLLRQLL